MMAPVVAGMIVTDEKNAFKGLCVNKEKRRGEEDAAPLSLFLSL